MRAMRFMWIFWIGTGLALGALAEEPVGPGGERAPFQRYEHPRGYFALDRAPGWQVSGGQERYVTFVPEGEDPADPHSAFSVLFLPVGEKEEAADRAKRLVAVAERLLDEILSRLEESKSEPPREAELAGCEARIHPFVYAGASPGRGEVIAVLGKEALYFLIWYRPDGRGEGLDGDLRRFRSSFTLQPGGAEPERSKSRRFIDPADHFELELPLGWRGQSHTGAEGSEHLFLQEEVEGGAGEGRAALVVLNRSGTVEGKQFPLSVILPGLESSLRRREPGLVELERSHLQIGGEPAVRVDYRLQGKAGTMRRRVWFVQHRGVITILLGTAREVDFATHLPAFESLVRSFRFRSDR